MNHHLRIIAIVKVKEEKIEIFKSEVEKLSKATQEEKGCIQYDFHKDLNQSNVFSFFEIWENRYLWCDHMESNPMKIFKANTNKIIKEKEVFEMKFIAY